MQLDDPVVAYIAQSNIEATLLQAFLTDRDIPANVIKDESLVGETLFGRTVLHRPKVWVGKKDIQRVHEFLAEFEALKASRQKSADSNDHITATCEACDTASEFPAAQSGTTQKCPHCGGYIDVGELGDDWTDVDFGEPE